MGSPGTGVLAGNSDRAKRRCVKRDKMKRKGTGKCVKLEKKNSGKVRGKAINLGKN